MERLHYIWYLCALNALLGAVGKEIYSTMNKPKRIDFSRCLANIHEDLDIPSGAKCIIAAVDNNLPEVIAEQNAAILRKGSKKTKPAYLKMYTGNNKTSKPDFKTRYVL
ncbi:unnamed protein product [Enterobius vermicularis]|uniref:FLYWCH-type domain-containing protein n=1 Tax=Enterobius vermicularis TaxID=51028 RepID=A0A0N4VFH5_ENTVE|nr:unnamed protein product [Enterobius vermicularis]